MNGTDNRENIIEVNDVYKSFRVYFDKGSMLKEQFINPGRSRYEKRDILNGITFNIKRGETVALIGQNGCGKSTTLKMLTKILYPNKGTIKVNGKVSSLIELGAGFHPDMSGRENIYINASILGIKKEEVDKRIEEIIRFSELEEFIDNPIRTYSSGMYMRLAFSVAINVDADILLIDEILAVGDQAFQEKCIRKLEEQRQAGVTIIIVSHAMDQIRGIADRCIWIDKGRIVEDGDTATVCEHYENAMYSRRETRDEIERKERETDEEANRAREIPEANTDINEREKKRIERETIRRERREGFSKLWAGGGSEGIPLVGVVATLLMVLCHSAQDIYGIGIESFGGNMSRLMKIAGYTLFSVGRAGIPLLLLLTGFIFMSADYGTKEARLSYYKSRFIPLLITWEIWVALYQGFLFLLNGRPLDVMTWLREAAFIDSADLSHMWFARMFFLMMLVIPYISMFFQWMGTEAFRLMMIILWVLIFLFPGLDLYGQMFGASPSIPKIVGGACYPYYLCMGYLLSLYVQRVIKGSREIIVVALMLAVTVVSQIALDMKGIDYLIWYTYYGVSLMTIFGFDISVRLKLDFLGPGFKTILKESYGCIIGIYLVHRPVQMILDRYVFLTGNGFLGGAGGSFALRTMILWLVSYIVTLSAVYVVRKIPRLGKLLMGA